MAGLEVLKVRSTAVTSSFRLPRVQVGRLPTFEMPPPATIYGHIAGTVGEWLDPSGIRFSYTFRHSGKGIDIETAQPIERGSGRPGLRKRGWSYSINVECVPTPQKREFLLKPELTLYIAASSPTLSKLKDAFRSPHFAYVLGRSQDLATVISADVVDLAQSEVAFFSHTLLPFEWRPWVLPGSSVALPEAIDYTRHRVARQQRYLQVTWPPLTVFPGSADSIRREELPPFFWVDASDARSFGDWTLPRGLHFFPLQNR